MVQIYKLDSDHQKCDWHLSLWFRLKNESKEPSGFKFVWLIFIKETQILKTWFKWINMIQIHCIVWFKSISTRQNWSNRLIQTQWQDSINNVIQMLEWFRIKNMIQTYECSSHWSVRFTFTNVVWDWPLKSTMIQNKEVDSDLSASFKWKKIQMYQIRCCAPN